MKNPIFGIFFQLRKMEEEIIIINQFITHDYFLKVQKYTIYFYSTVTDFAKLRG